MNQEPYSGCNQALCRYADWHIMLRPISLFVVRARTAIANESAGEWEASELESTEKLVSCSVAITPALAALCDWYNIFSRSGEAVMLCIQTGSPCVCTAAASVYQQSGLVQDSTLPVVPGNCLHLPGTHQQQPDAERRCAGWLLSVNQ